MQVEQEIHHPFLLLKEIQEVAHNLVDQVLMQLEVVEVEQVLSVETLQQ